VDKFKADLGTKTDGINMESLVRIGNELWNASKISLLKTNAPIKELLKPLFCTVELNIGSHAGGEDFFALPAEFFVDREFSASLFPFFADFADYKAQTIANGQFIAGVAGKQDTEFPFSHIIRSKISSDYAAQLIKSGVMDRDLLRDILMVDFTRPIFSDDRCDLLSKLPDTRVANLTPEKIRSAFVTGLGTPAAGTPAAEFLTSINNNSDTMAHSARVKTFADACSALPPKTLVANALTVASLNRTIARSLPIIEFKETIASDKLIVPMGTRLDPTTCTLATRFIPTL
jgi:hypothetical protein